MSVSAGLHIYFDNTIDVLKLIDDLLEAGWTYNDHGSINYLPLGDDESFDWQSANLENWAEIRDLIRKKVSLNELVGLSITWGASEVGGELLVKQTEKHMTFSLSINRKQLEGKRETDVDWYLDKIQKPLTHMGYSLDKIKFSEYD